MKEDVVVKDDMALVNGYIDVTPEETTEETTEETPNIAPMMLSLVIMKSRVWL